MDPHYSRSKFNSTIDSIRRLFRNEHRFGQPNCDYCLDFLTATQRIRDLSCGAHQWTSVPVTGIYLSDDNRSRLYLIVCYSNPDPSGLPNHLCFCLPLIVDRSDPEGGLKLLACFAPESIVSLSMGLYWEDEELKYDVLEDWCRFWEPLKRSLWTPISEQLPKYQGDGNELDPKCEKLTLAGISYKDSVNAVARSWAESKEKLQNEIRG
jgi:hypothetical protein